MCLVRYSPKYRIILEDQALRMCDVLFNVQSMKLCKLLFLVKDNDHEIVPLTDLFISLFISSKDKRYNSSGAGAYSELYFSHTGIVCLELYPRFLSGLGGFTPFRDQVYHPLRHHGINLGR